MSTKKEVYRKLFIYYDSCGIHNKSISHHVISPLQKLKDNDDIALWLIQLKYICPNKTVTLSKTIVVATQASTHRNEVLWSYKYAVSI